MTDITNWYWNGSSVVQPGVRVLGIRLVYRQRVVEGRLQRSEHLQLHPDDRQFIRPLRKRRLLPGQRQQDAYLHDRSTVHGKYNGSATKALRSWASGGCIGFLGKRWIFCVESPVGTGNKMHDVSSPLGRTGESEMDNETATARRDPITLASLAFGILAAVTLRVLYPLPSTLLAILGTASAIIGLIRSRTAGSGSALPIASLILSWGSLVWSRYRSYLVKA